MSKAPILCPSCKGEKGSLRYEEPQAGDGAVDVWYDCGLCERQGYCSGERLAWSKMRARVKVLRRLGTAALIVTLSASFFYMHSGYSKYSHLNLDDYGSMLLGTSFWCVPFTIIFGFPSLGVMKLILWHWEHLPIPENDLPEGLAPFPG